VRQREREEKAPAVGKNRLLLHVERGARVPAGAQPPAK
jgi:hypothetical protein